MAESSFWKVNIVIVFSRELEAQGFWLQLRSPEFQPSACVTIADSYAFPKSHSADLISFSKMGVSAKLTKANTRFHKAH